MNFFEMLVLSKKLSFADGSVSLYDQSISVYPVQSIMAHILAISTDVDSVKSLYSIEKDAVLEYGDTIKKHAVSANTEWIVNTINLYGLGKIQYVTKESDISGKLTLENSPFVQYLNGKTTAAVDIILRGIIAGTVSAVLDANYDVIEIQCQTSGNQGCEFAIDVKEKLLSQFQQICAAQLP